MQDRRSIDESGSANRKGQAATQRSLKIAAYIDSFRLTPTSQPASETHAALFHPSWKRKPFLIFVFQNLIAKNVHLVAMMRLVFGF